MHMLNSRFAFGELHAAAYYNIQGNASLHGAQIVCIADVPTDANIRQNNQELIKCVWRYHRVLVDDIAYGTEVSIHNHPLMRDVKVITKVFGCDAPRSEILGRRLESKEAAILEHSSRIRKSLHDKKWGSFFSKGDSFHQLLALASPKIRQQEDQLLKLLENGQYDAFSCRVLLLIKEVEREYRDEIAYAYADLFRERLAYLQDSIGEALLLTGKVIVYLSGNFVLDNPRLQGDAYNREGFMSYLRGMKYVVINAKSSPLPMQNDPMLWERVSIAPLVPPPSASLAPFSYPYSVLKVPSHVPGWKDLIARPAPSPNKIRLMHFSSSVENPDKFEISWSMCPITGTHASLPASPKEETKAHMPSAAAVVPSPIPRSLLPTEEAVSAASNEPDADDRISNADLSLIERTSAAIHRSHQEQG